MSKSTNNQISKSTIRKKIVSLQIINKKQIEDVKTLQDNQ